MYSNAYGAFGIHAVRSSINVTDKYSDLESLVNMFYWTMSITLTSFVYVRHLLVVQVRQGCHHLPPWLKICLCIRREPLQLTDGPVRQQGTHHTLRQVLRFTPLLFFVLQFENSRIIVRANFAAGRYVMGSTRLSDFFMSAFFMPFISFFVQHLAGFSWSEICVLLFCRKMNLIFILEPLVNHDRYHWMWSYAGSGEFPVPWATNYIENSLATLMNCYLYYWLLKPRSLAAGREEDTTESSHAGETNTDKEVASLDTWWAETFWRWVSFVTPKSREFNMSWAMLIVGLCLILWVPGIQIYIPEGLSKLVLFRLHFPHAVAVGLLFSAGLTACWVMYNSAARTTAAIIGANKDFDPPASRMVILQCGLLLIATALIACYTALDLSVYPTDREQVWLSLVPTLVVGIVGIFTAASVVYANPWSDTKRDMLFRRSLSSYPLTLVVTTLIVPLFWRPGSARAVGTFHVVTADQYGHSELLNSEHRHFADSEASYFAARLLVVVSIVAVQLVMRTRMKAVLSFIAFSAFHVWIVADDHTDVNDDTVVVALASHMFLAFVGLAIPRVQKWRRASTSLGIDVPERSFSDVGEVLRFASKKE